MTSNDAPDKTALDGASNLNGAPDSPEDATAHDATRRNRWAQHRREQETLSSYGAKLVSNMRRRFIFVTMVALAVTLIILSLAVYGCYSISSMNRSDSIIQTLYEHEGELPPAHAARQTSMSLTFTVNAETEYENRYAWGVVDDQDAILSLNADHIASEDVRELHAIISEILSWNVPDGYYSFYRFRVFSNDDGTRTIYLLDCLQRQQTKVVLAQSLAVMSLATLALVFILLFPISRRITRSYARNLERQQRFVTDASHELKTPLTIISANNDIIERLSGETQWTRSTKTQIARLNTLMRDLIETAKSSEALDVAALPVIDLSQLTSRVVEDFRPFAEAKGKRISVEAEGNVRIRGSEDSINRVLSVLLDNAVKHGDEGGEITVRLHATRKHAVLCVDNPAANVTEDETRHLFDRFYRTDTSRARSTGGYGIGLSTAHGNIERHGGKLTVSKEGDLLMFVATLPRANGD